MAVRGGMNGRVIRLCREISVDLPGQALATMQDPRGVGSDIDALYLDVYVS